MCGWAWRGCPAPRAIILTTELKLFELTIEHEAIVLTSFSFTPSAALGDSASETSPMRAAWVVCRGAAVQGGAPGRWGVTSPVTGRTSGEAPLGPVFCLAMRLLGVKWHCPIEPKSKIPGRRWRGIRWLVVAGASLPCPAASRGRRVRRYQGIRNGGGSGRHRADGARC